jgi:GNAT superfamily N-acetyltransferase
MCASPVLRPARPADAPKVAEIWHAGWLDGHLGHTPDALVAVRTRQSFDQRAVDRIGDTVVASGGEDIAGFIMVVGDEVEQVYVAGGHRGTGLAALLLAEAARRVAANGHDRAWLAVASGNARARRFYAREGWVDEGAFDYMAKHESGTIAVPSHRYVKQLR